MKTNCHEVPKVIDYCNTLNATINLSFVENPSEMALWTMCSKDLKELELFYNSYNFKPHKGVNAEYNLKAYQQFVQQISTYQKTNQKIEDEFYQNLRTEDECRNILEETLNEALKLNIIFESDKKEILKIVNSVESKLKGSAQHIYFGNLAKLLEENCVEPLKQLFANGFDKDSLENKLQEMTIMPNIYNKSYKKIHS
ncbi:MAG: hypothetical protein C0596_08410 [Marinilabiliales bacterium]|nr:MAG: hypothetical protein C0596_08410 [Marinilabiliales bacterium]